MIWRVFAFIFLFLSTCEQDGVLIERHVYAVLDDDDEEELTGCAPLFVERIFQSDCYEHAMMLLGRPVCEGLTLYLQRWLDNELDGPRVFFGDTVISSLTIEDYIARMRTSRLLYRKQRLLTDSTKDGAEGILLTKEIDKIAYERASFEDALYGEEILWLNQVKQVERLEAWLHAVTGQGIDNTEKFIAVGVEMIALDKVWGEIKNTFRIDLGLNGKLRLITYGMADNGCIGADETYAMTGRHAFGRFYYEIAKRHPEFCPPDE